MFRKNYNHQPCEGVDPYFNQKHCVQDLLSVELIFLLIKRPELPIGGFVLTNLAFKDASSSSVNHLASFSLCKEFF